MFKIDRVIKFKYRRNDFAIIIDRFHVYIFSGKIKFYIYIYIFSYFPKFISVECVGVVSYSLWEDSWEFVIYIKWQAAVELLLTLVKER